MKQVPGASCSVLMVTFNSAHVILESLRDIAGSEALEIIVVDNNSDDETCRLVEENFPSVRLIRSRSNDGFAVAVNRASTEASGEVLVLLNPDAVVSAGTIAALVEMLKDPEIGVVAPEIVHPAGRLKISSYGRFPTTWRMFSHYFGISRIPGSFKVLEGHYFFPMHGGDSRYITVDWTTGACLAVRRDVWVEIGGLSERWFMYAEDVDFCYKINRLGLRTVIDRHITATHLVGGSNQRSSAVEVNSAWIVNLYDFYVRSERRSISSRLAWLSVVSVGLYVRSLLFIGQAVRSGGGANFDEAYRFRRHSLSVMRLMLPLFKRNVESDRSHQRAASK